MFLSLAQAEFKHYRLVLRGLLQELGHFKWRYGWAGTSIRKNAILNGGHGKETSTISPTGPGLVATLRRLASRVSPSGAIPARWKKTASATARTLMAVAAFFICAIFAWIAYEKQPIGYWQSLHNRDARTAVFDARYRLVGANQQPQGKAVLAEMLPETADEGARLAGVYVHDVPEDFWRVVVALEDHHFCSPYWSSTAAGALASVGLGVVREGRGGSTLSMQLASNLGRWKVEQSDLLRQGSLVPGYGFFIKARRKIREIANAPVLYESLKGNDCADLKRWVTTHVPLVAGQIGGSNVGLGSAASVLFGKTPQELNIGEQAVLAAMLQLNASLRAEPTEGSRKRWHAILERARYGLIQAFPDEHDPKRIAGMKQIDAMPDSPLPKFPSTTGTLPIPFKARGHLINRTVFLTFGESIESTAELQDAGIQDSNGQGKLLGARLTLDTFANQEFKNRAKLVLRQTQDALLAKCKLAIPLIKSSDPNAPWKLPSCIDRTPFENDETTQVLMVLADEDGRIVRYFQWGSVEPIYAGVAGRSETGKHDPLAEQRDIGSMAKVPAALVLASLGDTADTRYCREYFQGRKDFDGSTGFASCDRPGAWITARDTLARSSNLALYWRLKRVPESRLSEAAHALGMALPADESPAAAIAFGQLRAAPRDVHSMMHAIGSVLAQHQTVSPVRIVDSVQFSNGKAWQRLGGESGIAKEVEILLAQSQGRQFIQEVLSAPISAPYGTMHFLQSRWGVHGGKGNVAFHIGKTGTPIADSSAASDKWVAGALVWNGHLYSYLTMLRAPYQNQHPLGHGIFASDFSQVLFTLLGELQ